MTTSLRPIQLLFSCLLFSNCNSAPESGYELGVEISYPESAKPRKKLLILDFFGDPQENGLEAIMADRAVNENFRVVNVSNLNKEDKKKKIEGDREQNPQDFSDGNTISYVANARHGRVVRDQNGGTSFYQLNGNGTQFRLVAEDLRLVAEATGAVKPGQNTNDSATCNLFAIVGGCTSGQIKDDVEKAFIEQYGGMPDNIAVMSTTRKDQYSQGRPLDPVRDPDGEKTNIDQGLLSFLGTATDPDEQNYIDQKYGDRDGRLSVNEYQKKLEAEPMRYAHPQYPVTTIGRNGSGESHTIIGLPFDQQGRPIANAGKTEIFTGEQNPQFVGSGLDKILFPSAQGNARISGKPLTPGDVDDAVKRSGYPQVATANKPKDGGHNTPEPRQLPRAGQTQPSQTSTATTGTGQSTSSSGSQQKK